MKEMIYQADRKTEVLDTGTCFGFFYWILNLGTHPTAYIKIPKDHKFYLKENDEIDIEVHGGFTYSENHLYIDKNQTLEGWFIGWDYGHYGDYAGYELKIPKEYRVGGKKWTTEEIKKEVREVCRQLLED